MCIRDSNKGLPFGSKDEATIKITSGDMNGDNNIDLILANRNGQENRIYFGPNFEEFSVFGTGKDETRGVVVMDMDSDKYLDIIVANIGEKNAIYFGDADGLYKRKVLFGGNKDGTMVVAVGDLDNDYDMDIVVGNNGQKNHYYINDNLKFSLNEFGNKESITQMHSSSWVQIGNDIDGGGGSASNSNSSRRSGGTLDGGAGDKQGYSVSLSSDGITLAVGALGFDNNRGTIRAYSLVNKIPLAYDQSLTTIEDIPLDIILEGKDVENGSLTYTVVDNPSGGKITINGNIATFNPNNGFIGMNSVADEIRICLLYTSDAADE